MTSGAMKQGIPQKVLRARCICYKPPVVWLKTLEGVAPVYIRMGRRAHPVVWLMTSGAMKQGVPQKVLRARYFWHAHALRCAAGAGACDAASAATWHGVPRSATIMHYPVCLPHMSSLNRGAHCRLARCGTCQSTPS